MPRVIPAVAGSANLDAAISSRTAETAYVALRAGTTVVPIVRPSLAATVIVTAGVGAWVLGAYAQIAAAADLTSHMLSAIYCDVNAGANDRFQLDIATGAAASEVVIGTFFLYPNGTSGFGDEYYPVVPMLQIPANARVAARCASLAGSDNIGIKLGFYPRPLV